MKTLLTALLIFIAAIFAGGCGTTYSENLNHNTRPKVTKHTMKISKKIIKDNGETKAVLVDISTGRKYFVDDLTKLLGIRLEDEEQYIVNITENGEIYGIDPNYRKIEITKRLSPIIVLAQVTGGGDGDKYYYYDIKILEVIRNTIEYKIVKSLKVARLNYLEQPELKKIYAIELDYYNEIHPEYGLTIKDFKKHRK